MCGITGYYNFQKDEAVTNLQLERMSSTLVHRGPDDDGIYVSSNQRLGFGFRRLAIIDLSALGHQPMSNARGTVWTMFNGEIYNYRELRADSGKKGYRFVSKSDTETIIHSYEAYGLDAVHRWNGMFAVALWDDEKRRLLLVRDRLGIKPLYYTVQNGALIFGSEIKAILAHSSVQKKLNERAVYDYLSFACTPGPETLFEGIHKLAPGHYLTVDEKGVQEREYWSILDSMRSPEKASEEEFVSRIRATLTESVEMQMVSDVPFGVFLSGGIDSSTNVALMTAARKAPVDSFSVNVNDLARYDEFEWARKVSRKFGSRHHEITVGPRELLEFLPILAHHADDPNGDPVCFPLYYVSKLIRDSGVIVAQVGEGSDEIFSGYDHYLLVLNFWKKWWRRLQSLPVFMRQLIFAGSRINRNPRYDLHREHLRRLANSEEFFWGGAIAFTEFTKRAVISPEFAARMKGYSSFSKIAAQYGRVDDEAPGADFLNRMIYLELKLRLPELLLMRVDKITMANSIESRVPFLDHRLVETAMQIPMDLKIKNGVSKYVLKQAVRGIIPDEIIDRRKQGFGAPVGEWLCTSLKKELPEVLWNSKIWDANILNRKAVEKLLEDHQNGRAETSFRIWNLITLALWYDEWMH